MNTLFITHMLPTPLHVQRSRVPRTLPQNSGPSSTRALPIHTHAANPTACVEITGSTDPATELWAFFNACIAYPHTCRQPTACAEITGSTDPATELRAFFNEYGPLGNIGEQALSKVLVMLMPLWHLFMMVGQG